MGNHLLSKRRYMMLTHNFPFTVSLLTMQLDSETYRSRWLVQSGFARISVLCTISVTWTRAPIFTSFPFALINIVSRLTSFLLLFFSLELSFISVYTDINLFMITHMDSCKVLSFSNLADNFNSSRTLSLT